MFQGFIEDIYFFDFLQLANLKTIIKHYRDLFFYYRNFHINYL